MIERAFAWADSNKKSRVSPVHGEPEAFLLLSDGFEINVTDVEENEQEGNIQVEEPRVIKPHNITWLKFKKLPTIFIYFLSAQNMFCIDSCFPGPSWVPFRYQHHGHQCFGWCLAVESAWQWSLGILRPSNCRLWGWKCCWCYELQASWMCRIPIEFFWGWCCDGTWLFSKKAPLKQKHLGMLPDLLRLCFPAVVANASPLTVLPQFVEVLGKKLDKISAELDRTCYNVSCSW